MKTVLYYTSNRENPEFEEKICQNIIENCGDLPIISVSQKPINMGQNICVGDIGQSYDNEWKQILIGAKAAKTKYLVFCESDFLYPKEYFEWEPKYECVYRASSVWIVYSDKDKYFKKKYSEGAQIVRRDYLIDALEYNLNKATPEQKRRNLHSMPYKMFNRNYPCVSFKTSKGTRRVTNTLGESRESLPIWGNVKDLKNKYDIS